MRHSIISASSSASRRSRPYLGRAVLLSLALAGVAAAAQDPPRPPEGEPSQPTFRAEANYVRVDVYPTVDGKPVLDLSADDFEVYEDGVRQSIQNFELVRVEGNVPSEERREPSSMREARAMAEDSRARLFVVFLDTQHVDVIGSNRIRQPLVDTLNGILGPDDLFAVMTPEMSARDISLARRTDTVEGMLARYWAWGREDFMTTNDPEEQLWEMCYPAARDVAGRGSGIAEEMKARRRERRTLDALSDLALYLRGVREERKAVIVVSSGWELFRPNPALTRQLGDTPPGRTQIGVGPDGRLTTDKAKAGNLNYSQFECDAARQHLAYLDNWQAYQDILGDANRSNVSFYPIDPRGLAATDSMWESPEIDRARLRTRLQTLRTLADDTDGLAVIDTNDLRTGVRRIVSDLTSYYLLGYYSTNTALDGKYRKLRVKVARPGVDVRARRGYRAASADEITQGKTAAEIAEANAPPSAVQAALNTLGGARPGLPLRTTAGYSPGVRGASRVWAVAELDAATAKGRDWSAGAEAELLLAGDGGAPLGRKTVPVPAAHRAVQAEFENLDLPPGGEVTLRVRLRPAAGGMPVTDTLRFTVPGDASASAAPRLLRRGPATGLEYVPTADRRFRRTERVRIEWPLASSDVAVSGEVLDRTGQPLDLPVAAVIVADADGRPWLRADVTLAPLAPGDYAVRVRADQEGTAREHVGALRIVP